MKKRKAVNPATPERYRRLLDVVGLSQVGAGKFLGINSRTSRRFASGDSEIPDAIFILLEIMAAKKIDPDTARKIARFQPIEGLNRVAGYQHDD